ncbi:unnamed protein product [Cylindrotheca closterium]|uniref:VWFD domain-containing protein n=1 Tax=Cylindrotheca closterium TaxID=2856 RepID=A0AAD2G6L0_9STRA|nr:unnamed protein product [Cylindrotheca closterium]
MKSAIVFPLLSILVEYASSYAPVRNQHGHESNGALITDPYDYFATPPETATAKCALINTVMDESGSMQTEQAFLQATAFPGMTQDLYSDKYGYDYVFLCSHGFGRRFGIDPSWYRYLGCSLFNKETGQLQNSLIDNWYAVGKREDGWAAIQKGIVNVTATIDGIDLLETCKTMDKNMILVSDEDRDAEDPTVTLEATRAMLDQYGYVLNVVVPISILGDLNNLGMRISNGGATSTIFAADGAGGWRAGVLDKPLNEIAKSTGGMWAFEHYHPLVIDTPGAIWAVESVRRGVREFDETLGYSFASAFIYLKVHEIACSSSTGANLTACETPCLGADKEGPSCAITEYLDFSNAPSMVPSSAPSMSLVPSSSPTTSPPSTSPTPALSSSPSPPPTSAPSSSPSKSPVAVPNIPDIPDTEVSDTTTSGSKGDPHFTTWQGEHFEFHGQCDLTLAKDAGFANGIGLNVQIRTKLVRYWSYIKSAAILIGGDILEVQGSGDMDREVSNYWINFEFQGKSTNIGGFPLALFDDHVPGHPKRRFEIDLSSKYPGQKIVISTFKEFVKVDFVNPSTNSFGNTVGMLGNFQSGQTLSRDQATVMHDFSDYGTEWQVLPADDMLFHDQSHPQFPEPCVLPEDPRGQRRRLDEKSLTVEQAEAACSSLSNPLDVKDCVYDVLATQDLDMVGAF